MALRPLQHPCPSRKAIHAFVLYQKQRLRGNGPGLCSLDDKIKPEAYFQTFDRREIL